MNESGLSRTLWRISIPLLFAESVETLDHLIDTLFLARVGVTELGAIGMADSVMLIFLILPLALVDGIQMLTARRLGGRDAKAVGTSFNQGLMAVLLVTVLVALLLKLLSPFITGGLMQSELVGGAVNGYLQLDAYSIPFTGITFACSALLTSMGRTRVLVSASLIFLLVDVLLNYLFIFGRFGFPEMGMRGAAAGSIGAEGVTALFLVACMQRIFAGKGYDLFQLVPFDRGFIVRLTRFSLPLAGQSALDLVRWLFFFLIIERLGVDALAAANIVFTCFIIFCIPVEGFAETAFSMTSRALGEGCERVAPRIMAVATKGALLATLPFILVALFLPQHIAGLFSDNPGLLDPAGTGLRLLALGMLLIIPAEIWFAGLVGTGDSLAALGIEALSSLIVVSLTALVALVLQLPSALVWLSLPVAYLASLIFSKWWLHSGRWKRLDI